MKMFKLSKYTVHLVFISTGILATVWFLIRVIPKPQRATYPCMRAAAPFMSSFVIWLLSVVGMVTAVKKVKSNLARSKYFVATLFSLAFLVSLLLFESQNIKETYARIFYQPTEVNAAVGTGRGIFPGRVVWVRSPSVAQWNSTGNWWDDAYTSQTETNIMISRGILNVSGKETESEAWDAIFKSYNLGRTGNATSYLSGEKIAIKINQNNSNRVHTDNNNINGSPQLIYSLLKSLIEQAGVAQNNITVFDASRAITNNIFNKCNSAFPGVVFVDHLGGNGRTKATYVNNAIPYSVNNGAVAQGIASCAVEADYLINMALLKGHSGGGVTLCGKNWFGALNISNIPSENSHGSGIFIPSALEKYYILVDFMGHKDLGQKTALFIIDGLYGCSKLSGPPGPRWNMAPFNGSWPGSIFISQDGVAIDAVGSDFLKHEFPQANNRIALGHRYLIEAAQANNPPSSTFYDPEKDGSRLTSLGVFESWNNATDKKYSRNLGLNTGIELIEVSIAPNIPTSLPISAPQIDSEMKLLNNGNELVFTFNPDKGLPVKIELVDLSGKILTKKRSTNVLPLSEIYSGIYIYRVHFNNSIKVGHVYIN